MNDDRYCWKEYHEIQPLKEFLKKISQGLEGV